MLVEVRSAKLRPTRRRGLTIVEAKVADESGPATATWFNQAWLVEKMTPGTRLLLSGQLDRRGFRVSEHEFLDSGESDAADSAERPYRDAAPGRRPPPGLHTTGLVPVHPATERLRPQRIREWVWQATGLAGDAIEPLPGELRTRRELPAVADALLAAHFPEDPEQVEVARRRLGFEELFLYQAALAARRRRRRSGRAAPKLGEPGPTGDGLGRVAALRADRRSAPGRRSDRRRPRLRGADAAAVDGRGRVGQDGGRALRDAAGAGGRTPGGADGSDRDPGRAARRHPRPPACGAAAAVCADHRRHPGGPAARGARAPRLRRAGARRRHPRPDRARGRVRGAGGLRGRRAAPLRGAPAGDAGCEGVARPGSPRPAHDRDPDPPNPLLDRLRRSRFDGAARIAGGPPSGQDLAGRGGPPRRRLRVHPRAAARGTPGLRRLPACLGVREASGAGGRG